jgi:hypothetical protein
MMAVLRACNFIFAASPEIAWAGFAAAVAFAAVAFAAVAFAAVAFAAVAFAAVAFAAVAFAAVAFAAVAFARFCRCSSFPRKRESSDFALKL